MLEELVRRWQRGWSLARGWTDYSENNGIIAVRIGEPDRVVEYVCTDVHLDEALHRLRADRHPPTACRVDVFTHDSTQVQTPNLEVLRVLPAMTTTLADHPRRAVAPEYGLEMRCRGEVIEAAVSIGGEVVGSGRMAVVGTTGVADMVWTEVGHRRRGLAGAVMCGLAAAAMDLGAADAVLMASVDGVGLYRELGWVVAADIVVARGKREEAAEFVDRPPTDQ